MKLSVIIPVYNGADFVKKSYDSIMNQELNDFEIIYVDNNSTDATVELIQKYVTQDSRVKLLYQPKQGTSRARNMGIANAIGDYVYIFDVDDEIYPNALNKMIGVLDKYKDVEAVFGKMVKSYQGIASTPKPTDETNDVILKDKPYWGLKWFSDLSIVVGPPAFLYRSEVFLKIGNYNEEIKNTEDTALDIKLGMMCNVAFLDTYIYLYFKHASSTIEMAKKSQNLVSMHWTRFVKSHLPFYLNNDVPLIYKEKLFSYLYVTTGKWICATQGIPNRNTLRKQLRAEIKPIKFPFLLNIYLIVMVFFPFSFIRKFYVYYLVPYFINNHLKNL